MRFTLDEVIQATGGDPHGAVRSAPVQITGVSTDTRTLRPGDLFIPLRGPQHDGHTFIGDAFERGAAAVLTSQRVPPPAPEEHARSRPLISVPDTLAALGDLAAFYRRTLAVRVVGVTGSVGKTATAAMCAAVLETAYRVVRTRDDWNAEIGVPLAVLGMDEGVEVAVIEMAMRGVGQIADLVRIARPEIGVVTNIGESHLELLGTLENVARAKGELIEGLPAGGTAVLNAEDARVLKLRERSPASVLTFGLTPAADVRGERASFVDDGMRFRLIRSDGAMDVSVRAWGLHTVRNALAAAAVAQAMRVGLEAVGAGLARWTPPKMRLQPFRLRDTVIIDDAYNASPASMTAALEVLRHVGGTRRRIVVLGEMKELGEQSAVLHRAAGREAAAAGAVVLAVGGADAEELAAGAREAGTGAVVYHEPDAAAAAGRLRSLVRGGDVILIKGSRAMAMERVVDALRADLGSPRGVRS